MLPRREEKLADPETGLTFWMKATESRFPWARDETRNQIRQWIKEAERADTLHAAGERVYPLLLSGETRCGKTSTMCSIAGKHFSVPCFRMNIAVTIGTFMGETVKQFKQSIQEAIDGPAALYIIDEVDGIFGQRSNAGTGGCEKEYNAAISVGLSMIENLPQHVMLVATTNEPKILDRAMLARFTHLPFPTWDELDEVERRAFARSHQLEDAWVAQSYAEVVHAARRARVEKILASTGTKGRDA